MLLAVFGALLPRQPAPVTTGGIRSTATTYTGPSESYHHRWRYLEHCYQDNRPQPHHQSYTNQSLPMRIGPDETHQVARSTKFHFKTIT